MIIASAPGKCILLGEHAVVYGYPAISVAINVRSFCTIQKITEKKIHLNLPDFAFNQDFRDLDHLKGSIQTDFNQFSYALGEISSGHKLQISNISIRIESDLWKGAGLGSSASTSIAFLMALCNFYQIDPSKIPDYAFLMEKKVHKHPSGIDNDTCFWGGAIVFQNNIREKLMIPKFPILITYSGSSHNTGKIVESIKKNKEKLKPAFNQIKGIVEAGIFSLKSQDLSRLGELFNENHEILSTMGISTYEIEEIRSICLQNGAFGSKLSGAGAGGCVISLGELVDLQKIMHILQKKDYLCRIVYLDYDGGKVESE